MLCLVDNFDFVVVYSYFGANIFLISNISVKPRKAFRPQTVHLECPRDKGLGASKSAPEVWSSSGPPN